MDYESGLFGDSLVIPPQAGGVAMATPPTSVAIFFNMPECRGWGKRAIGVLGHHLQGSGV